MFVNLHFQVINVRKYLKQSMYCGWRSKYQRKGRVEIILTGLTPSNLYVCQDLDFQRELFCI